LLGQIENSSNTLGADLEAGLSTRSRVDPKDVDVFVVIAEPTVKSLEVAQRALKLIADGALGRAVMLGNRIVTPDDERMLRTIVNEEQFIAVPEDTAIRQADSKGVAPFDFSPEAPAVRAVRTLALSLSAA